ncbi:holo-ACP synthase [Dietzia cinnamea]|uniref:Holo-[acyl-carrier-protein] synthase n=2 Tax=Dietzia TaxID=37914 RepID=A0AAW5QA98_9ACTN|nr:holo-ACP synthase [Dietzia cinnamea]PWD97288.1 holo-ACP synthase [Dietzia maris]MBM7230211.1 holo-ACP synthase [Dietzia cinnamea]MCT1863362.1 holo-ACP synthase [Dietzia cinnamea]MCT2029389.1 holo-ACP synthase [Dietzia cinnamea]MCT2033114.1 holo-ACP synthase [Dietzia cinnamea]
MTTGVRGVGVDIVDLGAFAASLAEPGTRLTRAFSPTERRQCRERAEARGAGRAGGLSSSSPSGAPSPPGAVTPRRDEDPLARHLAARWAAKEAVIKAWSAALYGEPPPIPPDLLRWAEIETVCDAWGRPTVRLGGGVARQVAATLGDDVRWNVSLSHDGGSAIAFVVLDGPLRG